MSTTTRETLLHRLLTRDVLRETEGGLPAVTDGFDGIRARIRRGGDDDRDDVRAAAESAVSGTVDPGLVDTAVALRRLLPELDPDDALVAGRMVRRVEVSRRTEGVPTGFLLVGGDELPAFLDSHAATLVFCWREGSDPTAGVRSDLERLRADGTVPGDFGLGAVYGPANTRPLRERYDVTVAPTLLFCVDGRTDCRLVGRHDRETVAAEVEKLASARGAGQ